MGRIGEDKIYIAPTWFQKLYAFLFPYQIKVEVTKRPKPRTKRVTVVQGSFSTLFKPGLRKAFEDEYRKEGISGMREQIPKNRKDL